MQFLIAAVICAMPSSLTAQAQLRGAGRAACLGARLWGGRAIRSNLLQVGHVETHCPPRAAMCAAQAAPAFILSIWRRPFSAPFGALAASSGGEVLRCTRHRPSTIINIEPFFSVVK